MVPDIDKRMDAAKEAELQWYRDEKPGDLAMRICRAFAPQLFDGSAWLAPTECPVELFADLKIGDSWSAWWSRLQDAHLTKTESGSSE